jgi:tetratricopeptide (TPR) repeat protein
VISRNSSFTFRGQSHNLKEVAAKLGARYIVEGSVRKGGNRVRITAQLIDAEEDHHLWSEKWDRTLEDIFDVQDEVSEAIARRVAPSVTGHEQVRLTRKRPENLSAWEEFLQGLNCYYGKRQRTDHKDPALIEARQHFEKAVELEPTFADAHAYLAIIGSAELVQFITFMGLAASYFFRGDHPPAQDYARRAIQFNPSFAYSYFWLGLAQVHSGEYQEGESNILKAFELSPADPDLIHFLCVSAGSRPKTTCE